MYRSFLKNLTVVHFTRSRHFSTVTPKHVVTMYTKENCSLCVPVKETIKFAQEEYNDLFTYEEVDITAPEHKETWWNMYKYDIPVVHLNGKEVARHFLDAEDFFAELDKLEK